MCVCVCGVCGVCVCVGGGGGGQSAMEKDIGTRIGASAGKLFLW